VSTLSNEWTNVPDRAKPRIYRVDPGLRDEGEIQFGPADARLWYSFHEKAQT